MPDESVFVSESVTEGHPDKLCDQISDAVVDRFLAEAPAPRIIAECSVATGMVFIAAHFDPGPTVDLTETARAVIASVGYHPDDLDAEACTVMTSLHETPERARADDGERLGSLTAEQNVTVFGFACRQTPVLMPLPIWLSHRLARRLDEQRRAGDLAFLSPDCKVQVAVTYRDRRPCSIHSVALTVTGDPGAGAPPALTEALRDGVISPVFADEPIAPDEATRITVYPAGELLRGGPRMHAGLTGRKNGIDTYGDYARHSGAALSGKDPLRIDRIGAYAARYVAKNVVAAGLADECEVQLSYTAGHVHPISVNVTTQATGRLSDEDLRRRVAGAFDFRPGAIVRDFALAGRAGPTQPTLFRPLSVYGHMGREDLGVPWERTDRVDALR